MSDAVLSQGFIVPKGQFVSLVQRCVSYKTMYIPRGSYVEAQYEADVNVSLETTSSWNVIAEHASSIQLQSLY